VSATLSATSFKQARGEGNFDSRAVTYCPTLEQARQRAHLSADKISSLTTRQRNVLEGMVQGHLNKQIAWSLDISEKTVKMHRVQVLRNLDCSSTAGAIVIAVEASFAPLL
jgi:DNA-binding NarL/FixJ family response regulator